ncbi:MAG: tyrosine-type recombinase/integrase [Xanthomonadales bacterium]|nr:tyrosine-type recombinase/integrase [Xanthomonadales bacterium]
MVPLLGWRPATAAEHAPKGAPLPELWQAVERFVWNRPGVAGKTAANRRRTAELSRALPPHPTPADVMAWLCSLDAQFSPGTVENHRKGLAALYRYAADLGLSTGNPAALVPRRRADPSPHPITDIGTVWPLLMDACQTHRERALLGVMRFAGLRRGEALGLYVEDVNQSTTPWRLNVVRQRPDPNRLDFTKPKSNASRRELPVRGPLAALLAPVVAEGLPIIRVGAGGGDRREVPYLFPYREHDLGELMDRLRAVAPLSFPAGHKAWHALRDTLAVEMRRGGKSMGEVSEVLGHTSEYVTRTSYMGVHGASINAGTLDGLDGPAPPARGGAPPGAGPRGGARPAPAGPAPKRSKAAPPQITKPTKGTPCRASKSQRSLPGLSVQPVAVKPKPKGRSS